MARGTHIGMRTTTKKMKPFVFQIKRNKLAVVDLDKTDKRIEIAGKMLSHYEPQDIVVVSRKETGFKPVVQFGEVTGAISIHGRFLPGTLTNPLSTEFKEPKIMVITDPVEDKQAIKEARDANIPVIGIANTGNATDYLDLVIPANNLGKKSIGIIYYLLAAEYLKSRGKIKNLGELESKIDDFTME